MKTRVVTLCLLALAFTTSAAQVLKEYEWQKVSDSGQLKGGVPMKLDGRSVLMVQNTNPAPMRVTLVCIQDPAVTEMSYAFLGEVKYVGVQGDAYLEMMNYYPPTQPGKSETGYFSRTLAPEGELGKLTGTSSWRKLCLPFDRAGTTNPPTRLEVNLFLPGPGTVYLGTSRLVQPAEILSRGASGHGAWWSNRTAGLIGGVVGTIGGCLGSLLSVLAGRGRMRGFVLTTTLGLIAIGAVSGVMGATALMLKQPYHVWFVLLLVGVLFVGILLPRLRLYQRQYAALELRRMNSMD